MVWSFVLCDVTFWFLCLPILKDMFVHVILSLCISIVCCVVDFFAWLVSLGFVPIRRFLSVSFCIILNLFISCYRAGQISCMHFTALAVSMYVWVQETQRGSQVDVERESGRVSMRELYFKPLYNVTTVTGATMTITTTHVT